MHQTIEAGRLAPQTDDYSDMPGYSAPSQAQIDDAFAETPDTTLEIKLVEGLNPKERAWFSVVLQLGQDYPLSDYAKMRDIECKNIAISWAGKMPHTLPSDVNGVYALARNESGNYAPQLGAFEIAWALLQRGISDKAAAEQRQADARLKREAVNLEDVMRHGQAPVFVQQFNPKQGVMCECHERQITASIRFRPAAALVTVKEIMQMGRQDWYAFTDEHRNNAYAEVNAPRFWVCKDGKCLFFHDANTPLPEPKSELAPVEVKAPRPKSREFVQQVIETWGLDPAQMSDLHYAELTSFCQWWRGENVGLPTQSDYEAFGPAWKSALQERAAQREAVAA